MGGIAALLTGAMQIAPSLEHAPIVKMWTGLRPWSADGYPLLGRAPGWENVSVATGHGGIGFEASAVTGKVIALENTRTFRGNASAEPAHDPRWMEAGSANDCRSIAV